MPRLRSPGIPISRADDRILRNRLSRLLFVRELSDDRFAELTGIERSRLNRIKNSRCQPTVDEALRIARGLQIKVADIFWIEDI